MITFNLPACSGVIKPSIASSSSGSFFVLEKVFYTYKNTVIR
nr:MAG TPA: hypothetical protein [Caudoviricetes sp.]